MDDSYIESKMRELAELIDYEPKDITWLTKAMDCSIANPKADNRAIYANAKLGALGEHVMRAVENGVPFSGVEITDEDLTKKRKGRDYRKIMHLNLKSGIYKFVYDKHGFYSDSPYVQYPPLPMCDLYVEAIAGAIYQDQGFEYTKVWIHRLFEKFGYKSTTIYGAENS